MVKGGNVAAIVADKAYELGRAMADAAGYGLIGKTGAGLRRRAGADRHQGQCRAGLAGVAASRRAEVGARRGQIGTDVGDADAAGEPALASRGLGWRAAQPPRDLRRLPRDLRRLRRRAARRRLRHAVQSAQHRAADDAGHGHGGRHDFRADGGRDRPLDRLHRRRRRAGRRGGVASSAPGRSASLAGLARARRSARSTARSSPMRGCPRSWSRWRRWACSPASAGGSRR